MNFRAAYLKDLPVRALDLALHVTAALVLPGPWWLQWLPDAAMPVAWARSWYWDAWLSRYDTVMVAHRTLHLRTWPGLAAFGAVVVASVWHASLVPLCAHVGTHCFIDLFTHRKEWL